MSMTKEAFRAVQEVAEKIKNDETATVGTVSAGDVVRQGDLYCICIGALPKGKKIKDRQLVPGVTQGSRHVLQGECAIYRVDADTVIAAIRKVLPKAELFAPLIGPVFKTVGQCELDHPEHGNRILPAGEVFATVYQRALADDVRRQLD